MSKDKNIAKIKTKFGEMTVNFFNDSAPKHVENCAAMPKKPLQIHNKVHLCFDVMHVCGLGFLTSIADASCCRTAACVTNQKSKTLLDHTDALIK